MLTEDCYAFSTACLINDLARPKENVDNTRLLPIEREWLDKVVKAGYVDVFRDLYPEKIQYSWWDMKTRSRERNVGWRIDYFFVDKELRRNVKDAFILDQVPGSDHAPVGLTLVFSESLT